MDVDDVALNLVEEWLKLYNTEYNDTLMESDIVTWDICSYTKIGNLMYKYLVPNIYENVEPVVDSIDSVRFLRNAGHRVIFVTSFLPSIAGVKYQWLLNYGFIENKCDYVEAYDKGLVKYDYLIDDNPMNIINANGIGLIYNKPWNISFQNKHIRVYNWKEIVQYFKEVH